MAPSDLPGFYYDEEKKKYFRIQENHVLPAGAAHTRASVQVREHDRDLQAQKVKRELRLQAGTVKRSSLFLRSATLARRTGDLQPARTAIVRAYASSLGSRPAMCTDLHGKSVRKPLFGVTSFCITESGSLLANLKNGRTGIMYAVKPAEDLRPGAYAYILPRTAPHWSSAFGCSIQSQPRIDLVTYLATARLAIFTDGWSRYYKARFEDVEPQIFTEMNLEQCINRIWDLAVSGRYCALATDNGVYLDSADITGNNRPQLAFAGAEQLNLSFKDENLLMSGERSGRLNFIDIRYRQGIGSVARLTHSSAILGTDSSPDKPELVHVHGFSTTATYDLRYTKAAALKRPRHRKLQSSVPILSFTIPPARTTNRYSLGKKLAYSREMDMLVAASSSERHNYVTLYDAKTGRMLDSPLSRINHKQPVEHVDIRRIRDGPESILTLSNAELTEWGSLPDVDDSQWLSMTEGAKEDLRQSVAHDVGDQTPRSIVEEWERGNAGPRGQVSRVTASTRHL